MYVIIHPRSTETSMRKFQRQIQNFEDIVKIIDKCDVFRLGLYADDYPYIVPLSFGYEAKENCINVFFHCATQGRKIDLITADNRACAEFDIFNKYVETGNSITADYESVICFGVVSKCEGEEKIKGIKLLLEHTGYIAYPAESCAALPAVAVYKIECKHFTAKKRFK